MSTTYSAVLKSPSEFNEVEILRWQDIQSNSAFLKKAFLSYSFCSSVAKIHPYVQVCIFRKDEEIVGFLPFQFKNSLYSRMRIAERVGGEMSDYFGVIAVPGFNLTIDDMSRLARINFLHYTHLDQSQLQYGFPDDSPETGLLIDIGSSGDDYFIKLKETNKKLVSDTARRQRQLEKDIGPLKFCFDAPQGERTEIIDQLIRQKRDQYERTKVPDSLIEGWKQLLLYELSTVDKKLCKGVLSTLYAGDILVASHFGLQCGETLHFWFPVYNKDLAKYSPGRILMKCVIENANLQSPAIATIDRGAGVTKAKKDFANAEHLYYRGTISSRNLISYGYQSLCSLQWRVQKFLK